MDSRRYLINLKSKQSLRSDNGSEFINDKFTEYLKKNGIKQILSEASKPQSNGMVERINGVIKKIIQKSLEINEKFDWPKYINKLIDNINNSQHSITGFTPNDIQKAYKSNDKIVLKN
jgi:transposase InsO family protein